MKYPITGKSNRLASKLWSAGHEWYSLIVISTPYAK